MNCGALSQSLAEAEFFGHQAGSFTGATETRAGWFGEADGGTLFLDEIGDLPLALQGLLLRVLQEREVVRVGSRKSIPVDFRLVAATNINLQRAVAAGTFRRDLYYRLSVVALDIPPLRERSADILPLAAHFLELYSQRLSVTRPQLAPEAVQALLRYAWPGNIREVENVIHAAVLTAKNSSIGVDDLRLHSLPDSAAPAAVRDPWSDVLSALDRMLEIHEPRIHERLSDLLVRRAYLHTNGNQVRTAALLGVSRNVVRTLLTRANLFGKSG